MKMKQKKSEIPDKSKSGKNTGITKESMLEEYLKAFKGLGCLLGEQSIKLKEGSVPVIEACRKVPFSLHKRLKEEP